MVDFVSERPERTRPGAVLDTDRGPLTVVRAQQHQRQRWIVAFDGVHDRTGAEALHGVVLRAPAIDDPDELWVHELVGADVVEVRSGIERGRCVAVVANPAHDLLELDSGALVPMPFVVEVRDGRVLIDPPDGLFDP